MKEESTSAFALAIDLGGTFVDLTLCNLRTGERWIGKVLRQHGPVQGFMDAVDKALELGGIEMSQLTRIIHGTTLATNTVLERSNKDVVLVTTEGFEDVLEIGRHDAPRSGNVHRWIKPRRPIPRRRIIGVRERIAWDGAERQLIDETETDRLIARLRALNPSSVAVVLLNAHVDPTHEKHIATAIGAQLPGTPVSLSHEVLAQAGEYERTTATILNAYVQPSMGAYVRTLLDGLRERGSAAPLYLMASDGGIMSAEDAVELPIKTVLSGPAAGAAGAADFAMRMGEARIFTLDVGGTSSDVACAQDGGVDVTVEGQVDSFPIASQILSIHTVGAGGGSIASADATQFSVGPQSAGAEPGPICYGHGGTRPTVTDSQLVLGRLPETLAGGELSLDAKAARDGIDREIASVLRSQTDIGAVSIIRLANINMANAIRKISTERGRDPRDFALFAFGGAGGAHAVDVAQLAGISRVIVPTHPGVFTTEGLLSADLTRDYVRTLSNVPTIDTMDIDMLAAAIEQLTASGVEYASADSSITGVRTQRSLDLRYANQAFELTIPIADGPIDAGTLHDVRLAFDEAHRARYSYAFPQSAVEAVAVRVGVRGNMPHAAAPHLTLTGTPEPYSRRSVYFEEEGWQDTPAYQRDRLAAGASITGPAVIDDYDSTIVLPPRSVARVHGQGGLIIDVPALRHADDTVTDTKVEQLA